MSTNYAWSASGSVITYYKDVITFAGGLTHTDIPNGGSSVDTKSTTASSADVRFGDDGKIGLGSLLNVQNAIGSTATLSPYYYSVEDVHLKSPTIYILLPKHAEYSGLDYSANSSPASGYAFMQTCTSETYTVKFGEVSTKCSPYVSPTPTVTTYDAGNNQVAVKISWSGDVDLNTISKMDVSFQYLTHSVDSSSNIGMWMSLKDDPNFNMIAIANATPVTIDSAISTAVLQGDSDANLLGTLTINATGPTVMSGGLEITDNVGGKGSSAVNNIDKGTEHSLDMEIFSNAAVTYPKIAGYINLPDGTDDTNALKLTLTGGGTVKDDVGTVVSDTGSASDKAYLLYSTKTMTAPSEGDAIDVSDYVRASEVTDWASIRSVILYVPSLESKDWYTAHLDIDAPKAESQLFKTDTLSLVVYSGVNEMDTNAPVTDVFYGFKGAVTWDDGDDKDGIRPSSVQVQLLKNGSTVVDTVTAQHASTDTDSNVWNYTFDVGDNPTITDNNGNLIKYTVKQVSAPQYYTETISGLNITNFHDPIAVSALPLTGARSTGNWFIFAGIGMALIAGLAAAVKVLEERASSRKI